MKLHYTLTDIYDLEYTLALALEIKAEMGITPDWIETNDGNRIAFNRDDLKNLEKGEMTDKDYIQKHRIPQ